MNNNESVEINNITENENISFFGVLPVLPLRENPVFPKMVIHFNVGRNKSLNAVDEAMVKNRNILLLAQKGPDKEIITADDLYTVGTLAEIKQVMEVADDEVRVLVEGVSRAKVRRFTSFSPFFECEADVLKPRELSEDEKTLLEAYMREITKLYAIFVSTRGNSVYEDVKKITSVKDPYSFIDEMCTLIHKEPETDQGFLEEFDIIKRYEKFVVFLQHEIEVMKIQKDIITGTQVSITKQQREHFLREQISSIKKLLGDNTDSDSERKKILESLKKINAPERVIEKAKKELSKLEKMQPGSPEVYITRNYLDWLTSVPWSYKTEENDDLAAASEILDADHYGMKKVKERILEFLAVRKLSGGKKSPIICFVGPPGVGKTSVARSIARALNRKYVRMSLGGVKDEAEIRGHRRTYIGAMPGRIITALKQAGSANPLILLDEVDKLGADYRGSISSALLEVLDSEQNNTFRDHYIEVETDLSDVLFITTANSLDTIDRPLLDRMEVIELEGYTDIDKLNIAKKYIIPKQIKENGLKKSNITITDEAVGEIIHSYTREQGVRELERKITEIMRKTACAVEFKGKKSCYVSKKSIEKYLGHKIFRENENGKKPEVGVATGLAWTMYGGDTLDIEVNVMPGSGDIQLTGQLGDVMKESAKAAISYIRVHSKELGIEEDFYRKYDIHIHVPEGAVPKDGPSAGITMATALISALSGKKIDRYVAMTGEITITGRILPIGGLKEKSLAAYRTGIKKILIPRNNECDIDDVPDEVKENLNFVPVDSMSDVLSNALI